MICLTTIHNFFSSFWSDSNTLSAFTGNIWNLLTNEITYLFFYCVVTVFQISVSELQSKSRDVSPLLITSDVRCVPLTSDRGLVDCRLREHRFVDNEIPLYKTYPCLGQFNVSKVGIPGPSWGDKRITDCTNTSVFRIRQTWVHVCCTQGGPSHNFPLCKKITDRQIFVQVILIVFYQWLNFKNIHYFDQ